MDYRERRETYCTSGGYITGTSIISPPASFTSVWIHGSKVGSSREHYSALAAARPTDMGDPSVGYHVGDGHFAGVGAERRKERMTWEAWDGESVTKGCMGHIATSWDLTSLSVYWPHLGVV